MASRVTTIVEVKNVPCGTVFYGKADFLEGKYFVGFIPPIFGGDVGEKLLKTFLSVARKASGGLPEKSVRLLHEVERDMGVPPFVVVVSTNNIRKLEVLAAAVEKGLSRALKPCGPAVVATFQLGDVMADSGDDIEYIDDAECETTFVFSRKHLVTAFPGRPLETPEQMAEAFFDFLESCWFELVLPLKRRRKRRNLKNKDDVRVRARVR